MASQGGPPAHSAILRDARQWTRWLAARWVDSEAEPPPGEAPEAAIERARLGELLAAASRPASARTLVEGQTLVENTVALSGLRSAGEALAAHGVTWCAIKGAALVTLQPQLLRVRRMSDVDVVVAPWALDAAVRALRDAGAVVSDPSPDALSTRSAALRHPAGVVRIDLHGGMAVGRSFSQLGPELLRRRRSVRGVWVPDDVCAVLSTTWHRARGAWSGDLREVFDLWLLLRGGRDATASHGDNNTKVDSSSHLPSAFVDDLVRVALAHGMGPHLLLSVRECVLWFGPGAGTDAVEAALRTRLPERLLRRSDRLARLLEGLGSLPWSMIPIGGRYSTLAALSESPGTVLWDGGEYAFGRMVAVARRGGAAGGRLGRLVSRRG